MYLAYKYVGLAVLLAEANFNAERLNLPIQEKGQTVVWFGAQGRRPGGSAGVSLNRIVIFSSTSSSFTLGSILLCSGACTNTVTRINLSQRRQS